MSGKVGGMGWVTEWVAGCSLSSRITACVVKQGDWLVGCCVLAGWLAVFLLCLIVMVLLLCCVALRCVSLSLHVQSDGAQQATTSIHPSIHPSIDERLTHWMVHPTGVVGNSHHSHSQPQPRQTRCESS